jgi:signal transduction histidine kinase
MVPSIDETGAITGAIVLIEDVTERVAREAELYRALHKAEAANEAKSQFLATMSHELRTPLGAISGYVDLLLQEIAGPIPESQRGHLERVKGLSTHILRIVDEILTFSRLQAGREEARVTAVDAATIARNAAGAIEPLMRRKGLEFHLDMPMGEIPIVTDEVKVTQILINLLGNAVKFVPRGRVELALRVDETCARFIVSDTGPGIQDDDIERIFEPFTQVDTKLTRQEQGTGLGLPVSRQLARLLGGDVTVVSKVGQGSTFTAKVPRFPSVETV